MQRIAIIDFELFRESQGYYTGSREWSLSVILACRVVFRKGTSPIGWSALRFVRPRTRGRDTMALKLPTLLEGEALVAWLGIPVKTRTDYAATKLALRNALKPTEFTAFAEFQSRKLRPGETVYMYVHHLKRLDAAMPELDEDSKNKILFQQFLAGVPDECSHVLRANPDITTIDAAVTRAKLLLTVSVEKPALSIGAVTDAATCPEVRALQDSVKFLTERMSTLMEKLQDHTVAAVQPSASAPVRC